MCSNVRNQDTCFGCVSFKISSRSLETLLMLFDVYLRVHIKITFEALALCTVSTISEKMDCLRRENVDRGDKQAHDEDLRYSQWCGSSRGESPRKGWHCRSWREMYLKEEKVAVQNAVERSTEADRGCLWIWQCGGGSSLNPKQSQRRGGSAARRWRETSPWHCAVQHGEPNTCVYLNVLPKLH